MSEVKVRNGFEPIHVDNLWSEALHDLGMTRASFLARLDEFIARIAYRLASAITPISPAYIDVATIKYEVDASKIYAMPAGVDLARLPCNKNVKHGKGKFRVLYIGAFSPAYDFDQVFRAAELLASFSDVEFDIQGGGELAHALKSKVSEKLKNVNVVDRIVNRKEVARVLGEADALLLPLSGVGSIELGISSKLYEYQAVGKPIICCSSGMPARHVKETRSGVIVNPGDYKSLAEAVLYLKRHRDTPEELGRNGRRYVENNLSVEKIGFQMKELFEIFSSINNEDKTCVLNNG